MSKLAKALTAAAGNAAGESLYVEDVFSTYLYTGTGATQTITNGIDLDGEGGLVWIKERSDTGQHHLYDTERGATKRIHSNSTAAEATQSDALTAFNSDGFTLGGNSQVNDSGEDTCSWSFRKAEKFFDVVTWTGDGQTFRNLNHSLNGDIGTIIVKRTDSTSDWYVLSRNSDASNGVRFTKLNSTAAGAYDASNHSVYWTDTTFRPALVDSTATNTNISGATYVAYLFASDAGGFGDDGSESIIKCGSYTGNGSTDGPEIDLGFEPQWLLIKNADIVQNWYIIDNMRGMATNVADGDATLIPNTSGSENAGNIVSPTPNGFKITASNSQYNGSGNNIIYIAIRRPMKTPESGTEVFNSIARTGTGADATITGMGFTPDTAIIKARNAAEGWPIASRMTGSTNLYTNDTSTGSTTRLQNPAWDVQEGLKVKTDNEVNGGGKTYINYFFKRATGFFDVVAYTGTGSATSFNHNLGVIPKLQIIKRRNGTGSWYVNAYDLSPTSRGFLNLANNFTTSGTEWSGSDATTFSVYSGGLANINISGADYINYLFATLAGVSKVGSYTGTGSNVDVDCGFSAGARFILIKRTDSSGDWYVWDSERGIVAGNDPYLLLNSTAAEVTSTDYIDPLNAGFTVTSSAPAALNASGGTYLFMAIS